jgi:hypothetical protein
MAASERYKRGTRPPYISMSEGFKLVEQIYEQGGGRASRDLFSRITGNSSSSSSFVKKANALKTYGLVAEENGDLALTPDAYAIVAPRSPDSSAEAKKNALLKVEVFSKIYERHKGKLLPADEFLKNIIEHELEIPRELSKDWISSLKDSLKAAGLLYDRGDGKWQVMEAGVIRREQPSPPSVSLSPAQPTPVNEKANGNEQSTSVPSSASGHNTRIMVSGNRIAIFCVPDGLTKKDAEKLKGALNGLASIIDSMVVEDNQAS